MEHNNTIKIQLYYKIAVARGFARQIAYNLTMLIKSQNQFSTFRENPQRTKNISN